MKTVKQKLKEDVHALNNAVQIKVVNRQTAEQVGGIIFCDAILLPNSIGRKFAQCTDVVVRFGKNKVAIYSQAEFNILFNAKR